MTTIDRTMTLEGDELVGVIAIADVPNISGVVYPKKVLERFVLEMAEKEHYVANKLNANGGFNLIDIGAVVSRAELREDGALVVRAKPVSTPTGTIFKEVGKFKRHALSMAVMSTLKENIVQSDASLVGILVCDKEGL